MLRAKRHTTPQGGLHRRVNQGHKFTKSRKSTRRASKQIWHRSRTRQPGGTPSVHDGGLSEGTNGTATWHGKQNVRLGGYF